MRIVALASALLLAACSSGGTGEAIQDDPAQESDYVLDGSERLREAFLARDLWSCAPVQYNDSGSIAQYLGTGAQFAFSVDVDNELFYLYTQYEQIATSYDNYDSPNIESWGTWLIEDTTGARPIESENTISRGFHKDGSIRIPMHFDYICGRLPYADVRVYETALP